MDMLFTTVFLALFIGLPIYLTARNLKVTFGKDSAFRRNKTPEKAEETTIRAALLDVFTLLFGLLCTYLLYGVTKNISVVDFDTAVYVGDLHSPFHTQYSGTLVWIMAFSYVALIILCVFRASSPVISRGSLPRSAS